MNQDQVLSAVRWIVGTAGGYAVGRGWITNDQVVMISGIAAAAVPLVWSLFAHTDGAKVKAVAAMPGIKVDVLANAPDGAQQVARDPNVPNVVQK